MPSWLPGASGVPEIFLASPLAVVVPPRFAILVVREEPARATHSVVQDHVKLKVNSTVISCISS